MNLLVLILAVLCLVFCFTSLIFFDFEDSPLVIIPLLSCIVCVIVISIQIAPLLSPHCSNCNAIIASERYCSQCGYELIPHCIDCGEICRTEFCKSCGAEQ